VSFLLATHRPVGITVWFERNCALENLSGIAAFIFALTLSMSIPAMWCKLGSMAYGIYLFTSFF